MKLIVRLFWLLSISVWLAACQVTPTIESTPELEPSNNANMQTITPMPVPTKTSVPSPVPTITPIPPSDTPRPPIGTLIQISIPGMDLFEGASSWQASGVEDLWGPKYSPDGDQLAMVNPEGVMIYDAESLELLIVLETDDRPIIVEWSADGALLAVLHGDMVWKRLREVSLSIWEPASGTRLSSFSLEYVPSYGFPALSPDGKRIAALTTTTDEDPHPVILDSETGDVILELEIDNCYNFAFSPDGQLLAVGCNGGGDGIWDATTGERLFEFGPGLPFDALVYWNMDIVWSPQGDRIASSVVKAGTAIEIFDANTGQTLAAFRAHESEIFKLIWTPDGERLISASYDDTIGIWNLETLEEIKEIDNLGELDDIALSPDGKQLIVIRADGILIQIDMAALLDE